MSKVVDKEKREFLEASIKSIAASVIGSSILLSKNAEACLSSDTLLSGPSDKHSLSNILDVLRPDPQTLEYKTFGQCCWYCPGTWIVHHYQPVAFIECITGSAEFLISGSTNSTLSTNALLSEDDTHNYNVRIWQLTDKIVSAAMAFQGCKLCGIDTATREKTDGGLFHNGVANSLCGDDAIQKWYMQQLNALLPDCLPKLLYDSTIDFSWKTGCRDMTLVNSMKGTICSMSNGISGLKNKDFCIGEWGNMYPRQQMVINNDSRIAAGISATRALSIAGELGMFPFDYRVNSGKLQICYPATQTGFSPGSSNATRALRCKNETRSGRYGFVWWVPVTCCKSYSDLVGLCVPNLFCI